MNVIYIDSLFFLNLLIDYALLLCAGKICALRLRRLRLALGAVFGGVYAVLAVLAPGFFALFSVKILAGAVMVLLAFGRSKALRACVVFFAVSAAFGGAVYAATSLGASPGSSRLYIPVSLKVLAVSFAVCYAAISLVFRRVGAKSERELLNIKISLLGRDTEFKALRDTGNELFDPISGEGVIVASAAALSQLFPKAAREFLKHEDPLLAFEKLSEFSALRGRLRIISFKSVGAVGALMLCFRPDSLTISGKEHSRPLIGISRTEMSENGEFEAIIR